MRGPSAVWMALLGAWACGAVACSSTKANLPSSSSSGTGSPTSGGASTTGTSASLAGTSAFTASGASTGVTGSSSAGVSGSATGASGISAGASSGSANSSSSGGSGGFDAGFHSCPDGGGCAEGDHCAPSGFCVPAGDCQNQYDCSVGEFCDAGTCQPGGQCGGQQIPSALVPPNLLITLDRSCSMRQVPNGQAATDGGGSKWDLAIEAITDLMVELDGGARFGLTMFPERDAGGGGSCAVTSEVVPVGSGTEGEIQTILTNALDHTDVNYPDGPCVTPIDSGLYSSSQDPSLADPTRASFLILLTDGEQTSCHLHGGVAGCTSTIAGLKAQTPSVGTFVVGFGSEVNAAQLSEFANAGGEGVDGGRAADGGAETYYQAQDLASLQAVLHAIAAKSLGCVFALQSTPPDPGELDVYFQVGSSYEFVPADGGWSYDATSNEVVLLAEACAQAQSGSVTAVDVEYGCIR